MTLRDYAKTIGLDVGCSDSGCLWGAPDKADALSLFCPCSVGASTIAKVARAALDEVERLRGQIGAAVRRGFDIAVEHADISTHDGWHVTNPRIEWDAAEKALDAYESAASSGGKVGASE